MDPLTDSGEKEHASLSMSEGIKSVHIEIELKSRGGNSTKLKTQEPELFKHKDNAKPQRGKLPKSPKRPKEGVPEKPWWKCNEGKKPKGLSYYSIRYVKHPRRQTAQKPKRAK